MTDNKQNIELQLAEVESSLDIILPQSYREVMLDFPLSGDGEEQLLYDDPALVLDLNNRLRNEGFRGSNWPGSLLVIGGNAAGDLYFLDLARETSPVFAVTHEMEGFDPAEIDRFVQSPSFPQWVDELLTGQDWYNEVRRQRANKKWWQFWI